MPRLSSRTRRSVRRSVCPAAASGTASDRRALLRSGSTSRAPVLVGPGHPAAARHAPAELRRPTVRRRRGGRGGLPPAAGEQAEDDVGGGPVGRGWGGGRRGGGARPRAPSGGGRPPAPRGRGRRAGGR